MTQITPENERERIATLRRLEILDTPPEHVFDTVTRLLSKQLDVPIALITLIDETRQWFKSCYGLEVDQTPREIAFCACAILGNDTMVVEDASKDERLASNPLVAGPPNIRSYAGALLRTKNGYNLGTLCVVDVKPRTYTKSQRYLLKELATMVVEIMELRRAARSEMEDERAAANAAEQMSRERARELQASEERFQDITSGVPGVVYQFAIDSKGRRSFPYVSATIRDLLGLDPSAVMRDPETLFDAIHPDDRQDLEVSIAQTHKTLKPWLWEGRIIHASGRMGWFRGSSTPRKLDDGSILWNGLLFDITSLREAEERLHQAQKMETVGQLTGGVAHDFNNLLSVIMGNAELLRDQLKIKSTELDSILRAAARGAELTQRLLAFSRQQPLRPQVIDLGALISSLSVLLNRTFGETIEVHTSTTPDLWLATADRGQVENAVLNLALNARNAMPEGGKLTIECMNTRLDASEAAGDPETVAGSYVALAVSDNGMGMSDEVRTRAFEPFFTTNEVGQGSGLGLSMVYGFAKQSGGHVAIDSEEGHGTTVRLYLPRAEKAAINDQTQRQTDIPQGRGETILVIEDDPDVRTLTVQMLQSLNYGTVAVADAASADQALSHAKAIDLVLCDVILPGGTSGPEFVDQARRRVSDFKAVFISGYPADAPTRMRFVDPENILLTKPFRRQQLAEVLRKALE